MADGTNHAFLYMNGAMIDLNYMVIEPDGMGVDAGVRHQRSGQITGAGTFNGVEHAFRLDPPFVGVANVPEPGTYTLFGIGVRSDIGAAIRFRNRRPS